MADNVLSPTPTHDELIAAMKRVELKVGKMVSVERHPDAEKLYVEKVDFGETDLRTVVSGLVPYFFESDIKDRLCVFVTNLKPAAMRGIVSQAMVLVAKDKDTEGRLEFLTPPQGAVPGDIIQVVPESVPDATLNPKKKIFEKVQPHFTVSSEDGSVQFLEKYTFRTTSGTVTVPTIRNAIIS